MTTDTRTGIQRIADERARQIAGEGWTPWHDDEHTNGELALVGVLYATPVWLFDKLVLRQDILEETRFRDPWPPSRDREWDKRLATRNPKVASVKRIRELEKAGALIAAEIDRLLRKAGS